MKKLLTVFTFLIVSQIGFSQSEMSAFTATGRGGAATTFVTDYQVMGINPANLGIMSKNEKIVSLGLLEGGYSIYSEALAKSELVQGLKAGNSDFTYDQKVQAAKEFAQTGLAANIDLTLLAVAVQPSAKSGGFAFGIKERFQWYSKFNEQLSEILFLGYNADYFDLLVLTTGDTIPNVENLPEDTAALVKLGISTLAKRFSELLDGSRISMSWYREFNLSYGREIVKNDEFALYAGVGFKYLTGMAIMDVKAEGGKLDAFSAITPAFGINYGKAADSNPSTVDQTGVLPKSVGSGFGFDVGVGFVLNEKLKFGIAVNDIGSITWKGNVYVAEDDRLVDMASSGFDSYNLFEEAENIVGEDGLFRWNGLAEKKEKLPTNVRAGASFQPNEKIEAGLDIVVPLNDVAGSYEKALMAFGIDVTPIPWLRLSTGVTTGGNYGFNLPMGIVLIVGETWEAGVASRDVITFFSQNRPTLSLSAGLLRFKF